MNVKDNNLFSVQTLIVFQLWSYIQGKKCYFNRFLK